jgi:hypothetical protein
MGRELAQLGIVAAMGAGGRDDPDSVLYGELCQSCQVRNNLARSRDRERAVFVDEVALSVDIEEDEWAFEHGRYPRVALAIC